MGNTLKTGTVIRVIMDVEIANAEAFERAAKEAGEINGLDEGETPENPLYEILASRTDGVIGAAIVDYASFIKSDEMEAITPMVMHDIGIHPDNFIGKG